MTTNNGFATRDSFLSATKRRFRDVSLPGGMKARIRSLTAGEWAEIESKNVNLKAGGLNPTGVKQSELRLVIATVCDGEGNLIFTEGDLTHLSNADAAMTQPLVRDIREHCGLTKDVEGVIKNSETTIDSASHSSSAEPSPTS